MLCSRSAGGSAVAASARADDLPAASTSAIARVGTRSLRLVLTEKASRQLRRQRRVSLTLSATCRDVPDPDRRDASNFGRVQAL